LPTKCGITRFVLEQLENFDYSAEQSFSAEDTADIAALDHAVADVTRHLDSHRIDLAADCVYHYVWDTFADEVIERSKIVLKGEDISAQNATRAKLYTILTTSIKLLHPFMPFVTEAIWQKLPRKTTSNVADADILMVAEWPTQK
jgi:valyl-tRNA synthetase